MEFDEIKKETGNILKKMPPHIGFPLALHLISRIETAKLLLKMVEDSKRKKPIAMKRPEERVDS